MIRHALTTSELRIFEADHPGATAAFDACCLLIWDTPEVVQLRMLHGDLSRKTLRELVAWLDEQKIVMVRSRRGRGHRLPLSQVQPDGTYVTVVADLVARYVVAAAPDPAESDWAPL